MSERGLFMAPKKLLRHRETPLHRRRVSVRREEGQANAGDDETKEVRRLARNVHAAKNDDDEDLVFGDTASKTDDRPNAMGADELELLRKERVVDGLCDVKHVGEASRRRR